MSPRHAAKRSRGASPAPDGSRRPRRAAPGTPAWTDRHDVAERDDGASPGWRRMRARRAKWYPRKPLRRCDPSRALLGFGRKASAPIRETDSIDADNRFDRSSWRRLGGEGYGFRGFRMRCAESNGKPAASAMAQASAFGRVSPSISNRTPSMSAKMVDTRCHLASLSRTKAQLS